MGTIKIHRIHQYNIRENTIKIYTDKGLLGVIDKNMPEREFELECNEKYIYARIQWCGSNKLKLDPEITEVAISSYLNNKAFVLLLGLMLLFTLIALLSNLIFFGLFPLIVYLYPLYFISIGKNKYLKINVLE